MAELHWLVNGWLLTTYKSWDDPPSSGGCCFLHLAVIQIQNSDSLVVVE